MKLTSEQITKAKAAKSVEELMALAKENGVVLTKEGAAKYFAEFHREGELADEELDNVAGGTCYSSGVTDPKSGEWRQYAIVTGVNVCPYIERLACMNCSKAFAIGPTMYCRVRWVTEAGEMYYGYLREET